MIFTLVFLLMLLSTLTTKIIEGIIVNAATDLTLENNSITSAAGGTTGITIGSVTNTAKLGNVADNTRGNTVDGFAIGIQLNTAASLYNNTAENSSTAGVIVNNAAANFIIDEHTSDTTNTLDIDIQNHNDTDITYSTFNMVDGQTSIQIGSNASAVDINNNKFLDNDNGNDTEIAIQNNDASKAQAQYNWFNDANGPKHPDNTGVGANTNIGLANNGEVNISPWYKDDTLDVANIDYIIKTT